jgi:hypothetical protein
LEDPESLFLDLQGAFPPAVGDHHIADQSAIDEPEDDQELIDITGLQIMEGRDGGGQEAEDIDLAQVRSGPGGALRGGR